MACAGTLALALVLVPGVAEAGPAAPGPPESPSRGSVSPFASAAVPAGGPPQEAAGESRSQRSLAALQAAVRKERSRLRAAWKQRARKAVAFAHAQRGRPYVWGGTGEYGFDCSGLVQQAWRHAGVLIPRVSYSQYEHIPTKVSRSKLRSGDLVFFNRMGHVGIYVGQGRFVHAPRTGRPITIEELQGRYARNYSGAVRPGWTPLPPLQ
ncbi:hypothetical protein GCM10010191_40050 [Actinomadura vinacea]|uniref:NlpC/P60 domain-containing protein n=2 Tax=Actinomadura vinacea TaxID=115336 RepID=A0ABN3J9C5_9ACTN